jgi:pimeloyl-ACP methyl ester carboxylesterase
MDFTPVRHLALSSGPVALRQAGSGAPLLLIHGWRGSSRYWQGTLDSLADIRSLYAFDLPGHGETPPWQGSLDIAPLAEMTIELADRLGLARFDLVGHSFGGAVALAIAARWPQRVGRLVVASMGTTRNDLERLALDQVHAQLSWGLGFARPALGLGRPLQGLLQPLIERVASEPWIARTIAGAFVSRLPDDEEIVHEGVLEFLRADPLSALEIAIASASPTFNAAVDKVTARTLLICGTADPIMPISAARTLAQQLRQARLAELEGCGHLPMIEQPGPFLRALRAFIVESGLAEAPA